MEISENDHSKYLHHLNEQITFLIDYCKNFDNGIPYYARQMSTIIRTLVKDNPKNKQSVSLLALLDMKKSMKFYNTGYRAIEPILYVGLVGTADVPTRPPRSNPIDHIFLPLFENSPMIDVQWIEFEDWWGSPILVSKTDGYDIKLTRRDMVLTMAEKDGGVHIDKNEKNTSEYFALTQGLCHIIKKISPDGQTIPIDNIHHAVIRQISHELIISILESFHLDLSYHWSNEYYLNGLSEKQIKPSPIFAEKGYFASIRTPMPYKSIEFGEITAPPHTTSVRLIF